MVDLVITAANVLAAASAEVENGEGGATITAGKVVYRDIADQEYKLADSDDAAEAIRTPRGIALNGASDGQPLRIIKSGDVTIGATMTAGLTYYLSDAAGGICPYADLTTGDYPCIIGIAISTTVLKVNLQPSGVAL